MVYHNHCAAENTEITYYNDVFCQNLDAETIEKMHLNKYMADEVLEKI